MRTKHIRLTFAIGFALSLIGAVILFNPTLEFFAVEQAEKTGLPIGTLANLAFYTELTLLTLSTLGLIMLTVRHVLRKRS